MNIALIGATGFIGSVVLTELAQRGHQVTALVCHSGEDLLTASHQPAGISLADRAVAIADEIESPCHLRARFTAAAAA